MRKQIACSVSARIIDDVLTFRHAVAESGDGCRLSALATRGTSAFAIHFVRANIQLHFAVSTSDSMQRVTPHTREYGNEKASQWRWLEGDRLQHEAGKSRWLVENVEGHAVQKHVQNLRGGHGRATRRNGERRRLLSGSLQKVVSGHGVRLTGRDSFVVLAAI